MTPTPFWPTPTPLPPTTPTHPINLEFEIGQDWAYSAVQFLNQGSDVIEMIQFGLIAIVVVLGLMRVIGRINRL